MVGILKRSREEMEAGSKSALQNPEHQDVQGPRKKQMFHPPNDAQKSQLGIATPVDASAAAPAASNGTHTNGHPQGQAMQGAAPLEVAEELLPSLPQTEGWMPFRHVVGRVAQEAFTEFVTTLDTLAPSVDSSAEPAKVRTNLARRQLLWEFAGRQRAKLIKLLVLSQWCRNKDAVSKLIDIQVHFNNQKAGWNCAVGDLQPLFQLGDYYSLGGPDLRLSMGLLSSGKVGWMQDLGYLNKATPSPGELLTSIRDINSILTARLHLHVPVPDAFRDFTIRNGRVTFSVPDEFELALSVGSDSHDEQLYFVDFSFSFSPGGGRLPEGPLQQHVIQQIDHILATDGLQACYDFLHDLTLTQKLGVLKMQARAMNRSRWGDDIKVEHVHRALILQYWTNRPGMKNWIEVGIRRKRPRDYLLQTGALDTSYLSLRWHRQGKEVFDHHLDIDVADLSLETILKDTIAAHTNHTLRLIRQGLRESSKGGKSSAFEAKHRSSAVEPAECALDINCPDGQQATLNQEPISGRFALLPASSRHSWCEDQMNKLEEHGDGAVRLIKEARAMSAQDRYRVTISLGGWQTHDIPHFGREIRAKRFGADTVSCTFFRPTRSWPDTLCLCLSHHLSGQDVWQLVILRSKEESSIVQPASGSLISTPADPFRDVIRIATTPMANHITHSDKLQHHGQDVSSSHSFLRWIVSQGAAYASRYADYTWCKDRQNAGAQDVFLDRPSKSVANDAQKTINGGVLMPFDPVSAPMLLTNTRLAKITASSGCYAQPLCSIVDGVYHEAGLVLTNALARLQDPLPTAEKALYFDHGSIQIAQKDQRTLIFRLQTPIGSPSVSILFERMAGFARIATCVNDLRRMGLTVETFDLKQITASIGPLIRDRIASRKTLWADQNFRVYFSCDDNGPTGIKFDSSSPYKALEPHFNDFLRHSDGRFVVLGKALINLAPALFALAEQAREPVIGPHYAFRDISELKVDWGIHSKSVIGYTMRFAHADGEPCWRLSLNKTSDASSTEWPKKIEDAWDALTQSRGDSWTGMAPDLMIRFANASPALWHILDEFAPHLRGWYEQLQKSGKTDGSGGKQSNTLANGKAQTGTKEKERAGPDGKRKSSKSVRDGQQVITLD